MLTLMQSSASWGYHRVAAGQVRIGLVVEVAELGVPAGMLGALDGLGVGLQAESLLPQQPGYRVRADRVTGNGQFGGQLAGRQRGPDTGRRRAG